MRGHFEGERVGTPFPLLKICRNAWERRSGPEGHHPRTACRCTTDAKTCDKIPKFSSPWQQGRSDTDFADTVKFAHPENLQEFGHISYIS